MKPDSFKVKQKTSTFIPVAFLFKQGQLLTNLHAAVYSACTVAGPNVGHSWAWL